MYVINVKLGFYFANKNKKTCRMCERTWINYYLGLLVLCIKDNSPLQKD